MKNTRYLIAITTLALSFGVRAGESVNIVSPDGRTRVDLDLSDGHLYYSIEKDDVPIIGKSRVEIFQGLETSIIGHAVKESDTTWSPVYGKFSEIQDHHCELSVDLKIGGNPAQLLCRVFNHGVGFRYVLPSVATNKALRYYCEFNLDENIQLYYPQGEHEPAGPVRIANQKNIAMPMVGERPGGGFLALMESDLFSCSGFESMTLFADGGMLTSVSTAAATMTPWRVVLFGETEGDLLVNTVPLNLAAPCALDDVDWIKPGKSLWDWRIHGYDNGDFVYGVDTRSYIRLIDFAAESGIEYLTIDDAWFKKAGNGTMQVAPAVDIALVMEHARKKGVQIILYYDRRKGDFGDDQLFPYYSQLGASGMKYGFMKNNAAFTRSAIAAAADNHLLINFHDSPCPMIGVSRTMPNLITREYCHAQQDSRKAFSPRAFLKMAMVNALSGPLDQANGNFGLNGINAGERMKGPRKQNSYISTVVGEVARTLVVYSGLITLPDAPEEYMKKSDLFEFLKQMPATWDETRILNSKMGEYITTARRSGDTWFVGSATDNARQLNMDLDFLEPGISYKATLFEDTANSHGVENPEAYQIRKALLEKGDAVKVVMAMGGGHAMILRKQCHEPPVTVME